jgi:hypothetical protein
MTVISDGLLTYPALSSNLGPLLIQEIGMFCVGFDNLSAVSTVSMAFYFLGFHTVQLGRRLLKFWMQ